VQRLKAEFATSERHACELMSVPRSSYRYRSRRDDSVLREQLIELAQEKQVSGTGAFTSCCGERASASTTNGCSGCIEPQGFAFDASGASD
jgi:hypothetical protein